MKGYRKVFLWGVRYKTENPLPRNAILVVIKDLIRQIINSGRIPLEVKWGSRLDIIEELSYITEFYARTIYIGKRAVKKQGVRHCSRQSYRSAMAKDKALNFRRIKVDGIWQSELL